MLGIGGWGVEVWVVDGAGEHDIDVLVAELDELAEQWARTLAATVAHGRLIARAEVSS